jgi:hypothetical protein
MNLRRLPIIEGEVYVLDGTQRYNILNPHEIPPGMRDGIFSLSEEGAQFESRHAAPPFEHIAWEATKPETPCTSVVLSGDTQLIHLLNGGITITLKGPLKDGGSRHGYAVCEPGIPLWLGRLVLAQVLAGVEYASESYTVALEYILKHEGKKELS